MKKLFFLIAANIFSIALAFAQGENAKPIFKVDLEREVSFATINNKDYVNVTVELKATGLGDLLEGVKVIVTDNVTSKKIYKNDSRNHISMRFQMGQYKLAKETHLLKSHYISLMDIGQCV